MEHIEIEIFDTATIEINGSIHGGIKSEKGENRIDSFIRMHPGLRTRESRIYTKHDNMPFIDRHDMVNRASYIEYKKTNTSYIAGGETYNENYLLVLLKNNNYKLLEGIVEKKYVKANTKYCILIAEKNSRIKIPIHSDQNGEKEWIEVVLTV